MEGCHGHKWEYGAAGTTRECVFCRKEQWLYCSTADLRAGDIGYWGDAPDNRVTAITNIPGKF